MAVETNRSTKSAPVSLSISYLMGSAFIGISMITLKSLPRSRPASTLSRFMACPTVVDLSTFFTDKTTVNRSLPLILTLDQHGVPHRWVTWQQAVWYYAKERVAWEVGSEAFTVHGGRSQRTGERSSITANSIIAIRGKALAIKGFNQVPPLNNRELFNRDCCVCAFCGGRLCRCERTLG